MTVFGDWEPEDSWDVTDPVPEQVTNIRRRVALLVDSDDWWDAKQELLMLGAVLALVRFGRLNPRNVLRADDLETDIEYVLGRLDG